MPLITTHQPFLGLLLSLALGWSAVAAEMPPAQALKFSSASNAGKSVHRVVSESGTKNQLTVEIHFEITQYSSRSFFVFGVSRKEEPKTAGAPQVGFRRDEEGKLRISYRATGTDGFQTLPDVELRTGGRYRLKIDYSPKAARSAVWSFTFSEPGKGLIAERSEIPFTAKENRLDSLFMTTWSGGASTVTVLEIKAEVDGANAFATDFSPPAYKPNESLAGQQGWLPAEATSNFEIVPF